jgi:hypothetical protein
MRLEYALATCLSPICLFGLTKYNICCGLTGMSLNTQSYDWKEVILKLMRRADGIFIVPSCAESVMLEVGFITEYSLLDRTVFIMPPKNNQQWNQTQATYSKELNLNLPAYQEEGSLFKIGQDNNHGASVSLSVVGQQNLLTDIRNLLGSDGESLESFRNPKALVKSF